MAWHFGHFNDKETSFTLIILARRVQLHRVEPLQVDRSSIVDRGGGAG